MSRDAIHAIAVEDKAILALQDKLDRLLARAKPTKRETTLQHFRDLYPKIEAHLASGKLLKDILAVFNEIVHSKVCARTFNDMLNQERARRDENGDRVCCTTCGQPLNAGRREDVPDPDSTNTPLSSLIPIASE